MAEVWVSPSEESIPDLSLVTFTLSPLPGILLSPLCTPGLLAEIGGEYLSADLFFLCLEAAPPIIIELKAPTRNTLKPPPTPTDARPFLRPSAAGAWCRARAVLSALDGVLAAEEEAEVLPGAKRRAKLRERGITGWSWGPSLLLAFQLGALSHRFFFWLGGFPD